MPKLIFACECCAQPFTPLPNNRTRQKCCSRKRCRRRRRLEYQRGWHKARYAEDEKFRTAAKGRVKRHRRRKRAPPADAPGEASVFAERLERVSQAVLGMAVQLGEDADPVRATALVTAWADRGARLGISLGSDP
jgi:hypothetical protein